jgi:glycosyltransferase involved in cell wall biosynthesis
MRLLILTQKVDKNDDVLGFFHRWLEVFSQTFELITVICLGRGEISLPQKVKVYSLGKESNQTRWVYAMRFFTYIWRERRNYDTVFVHMNKEYVLLGGLFWRLWGKKVILWYNHPQGTFLAKVAGVLAHKILYTSAYSFFSESPKAEQMPVGIDTDIFKPNPAIRQEEVILSLGRIAPVKNIDTLIDAAAILRKEGARIPVHIYGNALHADAEYEKMIHKQAESLTRQGFVTFYPGVSNQDTPALYQRHSYFANLTPSGSFDKTIIEAMASGCIVIASNKSFGDLLPKEYYNLMVFEERDAQAFAEKVAAIVRLIPQEKAKIVDELRTIVINHHSLVKLADRLKEICTQ